MNATYTLDELCALSALPKRTVRYYVQLGLVDRPEGETRAARYFQRHLEQLLTVRRLSEGGLSLDRIAAVLKGDIDAVTEPRRAPGTVEVRAHITVADGVDIQIETARLLDVANSAAVQNRDETEILKKTSMTGTYAQALDLLYLVWITFIKM